MGKRLAVARQIAAWTLAAGLLAGRAEAIDGIVPENTLRASWSPQRDDAVLVDREPAVQSVQHEAPAESSPGDSTIRTSRVMRRPKSLSRPAPAMTASESVLNRAAEPLPSVTGTPMSLEGLPVPPSGSYYPEGDVTQALPGFGGGHCGCGLLNCGGDCCQPDCCGQWNSCGPVPPCCLLPPVPLNGLEFFAGVQGFTGPLNRGGSGSFGFHEGFNFGVPTCGCLAWQIGVNTTQNNFEGNFLTEDSRNQVFVTGGLYRRVDWGIQGGLVVDYLHDEWDYEADLLQLRGEISWRYCCSHEIGFWFTAGANDAENLTVQVPAQGSTPLIEIVTREATVEVNDLFAFFYRRQFACGGEGRVFGGWTANDQGLVGADLLLPINHCWSARAGFLYVSPDGDESPSRPDFVEESWNVGISLVWTPCPRQPCVPNYCRPLFNVADNGSFLTRLIPTGLINE